MKLSLKRIFAAAAIAGAALLAGSQITTTSPTPLTPEDNESIQSLAGTFAVSLILGHNQAAAKPDMRALATTALTNLADKSIFDGFTLTDEERQLLADLPAEAGNFQNHAGHFAETLYYVLMRAAEYGETVPAIHDAAIEVIRNTMSKIDAHTMYHTDEEMFELQNQTIGQFGGVGLQIKVDNERVVISKPMPGTPGDRAGLQADDIITHIDGTSTTGMTIEDAVSRLRGPIETDVVVTVERNGETIAPVTLTRAYIENSPVNHRAIGTDIGYVSLSSFNDKSTRDLENAINELKTELGTNMRGLILDLRGNPGGLVTEAISISDMFLESGDIVSMGNGGPDDQRARARAGDILNGLPLIVLTDFGSASASEIVAGALQDNNRALILGTQSFGKGSVQSIIPLNRYGAQGGLRLTTALYFTPSGESIQGRGITPNVRFENNAIRDFLRERGNRPIGEASREGMIANPTALGNRTTTEICEPVADADLAAVDEEIKFKRRDGTESFDEQAACAVDRLRGTPSNAVTNRPAPAPVPHI